MKITPTSTLPAVVAVLGVDDYGPCDGGEGSAKCPHCGADGRYVVRFLCEDGQEHGAMRGCFQLFPGSSSKTAKLIQEAFKRERDAKESKKKLASWWAEMLAEVDTFRVSTDGSQADFFIFANRILDIDARRQAWLKKNGYGYGGRR